MKILLPAQISPPRIRKDGSCSLTFDTREMTAEEIFTIMSLRNSEGWLAFTLNQEQLPEAPTENAEIETKSHAQRLRSVLYILYKQAIDNGKFVGTFDSYYQTKMETVIEQLKSKIED